MKRKNLLLIAILGTYSLSNVILINTMLIKESHKQYLFSALAQETLRKNYPNNGFVSCKHPQKKGRIYIFPIKIVSQLVTQADKEDLKDAFFKQFSEDTLDA